MDDCPFSLAKVGELVGNRVRPLKGRHFDFSIHSSLSLSCGRFGLPIGGLFTNHGWLIARAEDYRLEPANDAWPITKPLDQNESINYYPRHCYIVRTTIIIATITIIAGFTCDIIGGSGRREN